MSNPTMKGMRRGNPGKRPRAEKIAQRKRVAANLDEIDDKRRRTGRNNFNKKSRSPQNQQATKLLGYCGAKKRRQEDGSTEWCHKKAGWGTDHPGIGRCKYHGGSTPTSRAAAERQRQVEFMGRPKEISPLDAIIWAIKITAGEVEFLGLQIQEIDQKEDWIENTIQGKQLHVFQRARADAMDRLVKYSKDAIALGLAERAVRMAETFGATIATLLNGIAEDLALSKVQKQIWPSIVRKHLVLLEGGSPLSDEDRKEIKLLGPGSAK
jgi:hypothetical protein